MPKYKSSNKNNKFGGKKKRKYIKKVTVEKNVSVSNTSSQNQLIELDNINENNIHVNEKQLNVGLDDFDSASSKKINLFPLPESEEEGGGEGSGDVILMEVAAIKQMVNALACPNCKESKLSLCEKKSSRKGLATILDINCCNQACLKCDDPIISVYTSSKNSFDDFDQREKYTYKPNKNIGGDRSSKEPFAINVKLVLAARSVGIGHPQVTRFCTILGISKPPVKSNYNNLAKKLHKAALIAVQNNLKDVRNIIVGIDESKNTNVMFDGTWQKRGHLSHNGVGAVIDYDSGFCVDYQVLCNYCNECKRGPKVSDEGYDAWQENHEQKCQKNVDCSSNAMETEAALQIWNRSNSMVPPLKYTVFLSDGDSKAFTAVAESKVYGNIPIIKEDCANHVSKRLSTAIRKMNPLLPRGQKIKEDVIKKLTLYYRLAISNNKNDVRGMYNAILASFLHCSSTDNLHNHKLCPNTDDTWCFYNKAIREGVPPLAHSPKLNEVQVEGLKPIYKRLTDIALLIRCVKGQTQNAAESLNSKIWSLCPKSRFAVRTSVETATALAVLWFNKGYRGFSDVLRELNIEPSKQFCKVSMSADKDRIKSMDKKMTAEAHHKRRKQALADSQREVAREESEGITYGSGAF